MRKEEVRRLREEERQRRSDDKRKEDEKRLEREQKRRERELGKEKVKHSRVHRSVEFLTTQTALRTQEQRQIEKQNAKLMSFFKKATHSKATMDQPRSASVAESEWAFDKYCLPFEAKEHVRLAIVQRQKHPVNFDALEAAIAANTSYLPERDTLIDDIVGLCRQRLALPGSASGAIKLLQFHDNFRPAYFGTYSKTSRQIGPRNPLAKDTAAFNYEVDSDEEWEVRTIAVGNIAKSCLYHGYEQLRRKAKARNWRQVTTMTTRPQVCIAYPFRHNKNSAFDRSVVTSLAHLTPAQRKRKRRMAS